ncbi:MAG: hypothetical protein RIS73_1567 [Bacteroidota bacterium]|jgi:hypothetical protein
MFSNKQTSAIVDIFATGADMYQNHDLATPLLQDMAADIQVLYDIIRYSLSQPDFLKTKQTYTTLSLAVLETPDVSLVVNIFPSLPDKNTEISFQSVHHHGYMLLTTTAAFGPGYKAITFKKGFEIDMQTGITKMAKEKVYKNTDSKIDFVDANTPHIVFYPESISATYAMWSKKTKNDASNTLKKIPIILKFKKQLRKLVEALHLEKMVGIAKVAYYDFFPENGKLMAMKERIHYDAAAGTNDNFLNNMFHFIQKTGFNDTAFLQQLLQKPTTPDSAKKHINRLINNEEIAPDFVTAYLNIPKVNLNFAEVAAATG